MGDASTPNGGPSDSPRRGARSGTTSRILAAVCVPLILLYLTGALFVLDQSGPAPAGGVAGRYVPVDGFSQRVHTEPGSTTVVENARLHGVEGILSMPDTVASSVLRHVGDSAPTTQLWRQTRTDQMGTRFVDLYLVDSSGIHEVAAWGDGIGFLFDPPLPALPADAQPGTGWNVEGDALPQSTLVYESRGRVEAPPETVRWDGEEHAVDPACLAVHATLIIRDPDGTTGLGDPDGVLGASDQMTLWCPDVGGVFSEGTQDGAPTVSYPVTSTLPASAVPPAASDVTGLAAGATTLTNQIAGSFFPQSTTEGRSSAQAVVTASGLVVAANDRGDDAVVYQFDTSSATQLWSGHPGGVIVTVGAVADVALAATTQRTVTAYDPIGRRLWQWEGAELTLAAPIPAGGATAHRCNLTVGTGVREPECDVIVGTRDGTIVRLDLGTGVEVWRTSLGADLRGELVRADGALFTADERGRITALNLADGTLRWQHDTDTVEALAATDSSPGQEPLVVYATITGDLVAVSATSGDEVWSDIFSGIIRDLDFLPGMLLLGGSDRTTAYASSDGAVLWQAPAVNALTASATDVTTLRGDTVTRYDQTGSVLSEARIPSPDLAGSFELLSGTEVPIVMDSFLHFWLVGPS